MKSLCCFFVFFTIVLHVNAQKCGRRNEVYKPPGALRISSKNYVVGGYRAKRNEFPWQVSMQFFYKPSFFRFSKWAHFCGGSIINNQWIVTAAHCILDSYPLEKQRIVAGAHYKMEEERTTQYAGIERIFVHPLYESDKVQNDIALIKLSEKLLLNPDSVYPICLPGTDEMEAFNRSTCVSSGWGRTSDTAAEGSDVLLKIELPVVSHTVCRNRYRNVEGAGIDESKLCAGYLYENGFGLCQGDSGGPFACEKDGVYKLAGITSFGMICGAQEHPPVFTRVAFYRKWMDIIIQGNS